MKSSASNSCDYRPNLPTFSGARTEAKAFADPHLSLPGQVASGIIICGLLFRCLFVTKQHSASQHFETQIRCYDNMARNRTSCELQA